MQSLCKDAQYADICMIFDCRLCVQNTCLSNDSAGQSVCNAPLPGLQPCSFSVQICSAHCFSCRSTYLCTSKLAALLDMVYTHHHVPLTLHACFHGRGL